MVKPAYHYKSKEAIIPDVYENANEELGMILRVNSQDKNAGQAMKEYQEASADMSTLIGYSS